MLLQHYQSALPSVLQGANFDVTGLLLAPQPLPTHLLLPLLRAMHADGATDVFQNSNLLTMLLQLIARPPSFAIYGAAYTLMRKHLIQSELFEGEGGDSSSERFLFLETKKQYQLFLCRLHPRDRRVAHDAAAALRGAAHRAPHIGDQAPGRRCGHSRWPDVFRGILRSSRLVRSRHASGCVRQQYKPRMSLLTPRTGSSQTSPWLVPATMATRPLAWRSRHCKR